MSPKGIYNKSQGTAFGLLFTPLFTVGKKRNTHQQRLFDLETIHYDTIGINWKRTFGNDCPPLERSLLPLSLQHIFYGRGVFHSDNLPRGLSNAMWADKGGLCPSCCFPQGKERFLSCQGQPPFQADSTSNCRDCSHLWATSSRSLTESPALSILAITAENTTLLLHCRSWKDSREV